MSQIMTDIDIEFEHIWLEVSAERWMHIERFLLSYHCLAHGLVTRQGKADWEQLRSSAPRSLQVNHIKGCELEPVVPYAVVVGEIKRHWRDGELTKLLLRRLLQSLMHFVVITKAEKNRLKKAGLLNAMPAEWYQSDKQHLDCRFTSAGISIMDFGR